MNARAFNRMHSSALTLATVSSFLLLTTLGCNLDLGEHGDCCPPSHPGVALEDLTAIAAILNKTAGPLTVTVIDPPTTDVLESNEAILYEVSQRSESRVFEFQSGESVAAETVIFAAGGDVPGLATGVLVVSPGVSQGTLAVDRDERLFSPFAFHRDVVVPGSSVFLVVNATPFTMAIVGPGAGSARRTDEHVAVILDAGATLDVTISVALSDAPDLMHVFEAPASAGGQVSASILFVTLHENELALETQSAAFRRLE